MFMMLTLMFMTTIWALASPTPQKAILVLLVQTMAVSLTTFSMFSLLWFSYILLLILIGGLMVLFLYLSSLASNKMLPPVEGMWFIMPFFMTLTLLLNPFNISFPSKLHMENTPDYFTTLKLMSHLNFNLYIFMVAYLLIALIFIVNLMKKTNAPLRLLV